MTIDQIKSGPVLLDASVFITSLFTSDRTSHVAVSSECSYLLERCKTSEVSAYVAPEGATRLWKLLCVVSESIGNNAQFSIAAKLPQKPKIAAYPLAQDRMRAFSASPFHILRISSGTIERAVTLWERTGAGIEACVALCAFKEFARSPYIVVTANDHYDELASDEVLILKPDLTKKRPTFVPRPPAALEGGDLMIT